jgi:hypothetical protein
MNEEHYYEDDRSMDEKLEMAVSGLTRYGEPDDRFLSIIYLLAEIEDDIKNGRTADCMQEHAEKIRAMLEEIISTHTSNW